MAGIALEVGEGLAAAESTIHDLARELGCATGQPGTRTSLHQSMFAEIQEWSIEGSTSPQPSYDPSFQLVLAYLGHCTFSSGDRKLLIDCNCSLLIAPGWSSFSVGEACVSGFAAVLVKPSRELLEQVSSSLGAAELRTIAEPSAPSTMRLRLLTQLLRMASTVEPLQADEWIVEAVVETVGCKRSNCTRRSKAIDRAKEYLHAHAGQRLRLDQIAAEVGLNAIYLTQEFTRCEGVPLYRYQLQLRLTSSAR